MRVVGMRGARVYNVTFTNPVLLLTPSGAWGDDTPPLGGRRETKDSLLGAWHKQGTPLICFQCF